ncbi:MAG: InlB B-repeat-containing protein [Pseudobutyrivibrio sp.]|nr:InlB B-repeat-containing protein [Pseudobutyrivibrio sp.]
MYFYTCIQIKKDGTTPMITVPKETLNDADEQMSYDRWYTLNQKELFDYVLLLVVNSVGNVEMMWKYEAPVEYVTVAFDNDGGTGITSTMVKKGDKVEQPENPVKEGYTFKEWDLDGTLYDFDTPVTEDITLTAIWEAE